MKQIIFTFGLIACGLLFLLQLNKFSLFSNQIKSELFIVIFALIFLGFGIWVSRFLNKKENIDGSKFENPNSINRLKIKELGISNREYEVLQKIEEGLSNQEIAKSLFISESTVKTHVSNLLMKLDAKRRTQAVLNAKKQNII